MQSQLDQLSEKLDSVLHRLDIVKDQLDAIADFLEKKPVSTEPKEYIDVPDKDGFRQTCMEMLKHPGLSDAGFTEALQSLPKTVDRYGRLTSGQWKFFGVIHNKLLGTWPKTPKPVEKALDPKGPAPYYDVNDPQIPF